MGLITVQYEVKVEAGAMNDVDLGQNLDFSECGGFDDADKENRCKDVVLGTHAVCMAEDCQDDLNQYIYSGDSDYLTYPIDAAPASKLELC